jgi:hypothetical protein
MIDLDKHEGKSLVALNIHSGVSPSVEAVLPSGADAKIIADDIQRIINREVEVYFEFRSDDVNWPGVKVEVHPRSGKIKSKKARDGAWKKTLSSMSDAFSKGEKKFQKRLANNPDNGRFGYWHVDGIRHHELVKAKSAEEAIKNSVHVGDWEVVDCAYVGEEVPNNFSM